MVAKVVPRSVMYFYYTLLVINICRPKVSIDRIHRRYQWVLRKKTHFVRTLVGEILNGHKKKTGDSSIGTFQELRKKTMLTSCLSNFFNLEGQDIPRVTGIFIG